MYRFINRMSAPRPISANRHVPMMPPNADAASKTVSLFSQPYLDTYNQCYKNIVVVNLPPQGPLADLVVRVNFPPLKI